MSYSTGWLVNAIKYLESSVFVYRNGRNIALPIENSQRLDRLARYVSSYAEIAIESGALMFTPYGDESAPTTDTITAIEEIEAKKVSNGGNLIDPIQDATTGEMIQRKSRNIIEALNELNAAIIRGGTDFKAKYTTNIFEGMTLTA